MNATQTNFQAQTNVETAKASRYLQALCGHFSSKVNTKWTKVDGEVDFGFGRCSMTAWQGILKNLLLTKAWRLQLGTVFNSLYNMLRTYPPYLIPKWTKARQDSST